MKHKNTRKITYRKSEIPVILLEGKWLEKDYGLKIGDEVELDFSPREIRIKMNNIN